MNYLKAHNDRVVLHVLVQPRSSMNKMVGIVDNRLKIKLKAPPVDGAANKMCIQFLAKALHVPKSHIGMVSGQRSRKKTFQVAGDPVEITQCIKRLIQ
ncbi:MAG: hypothetical protein OMM_07236 [Candidatus Magnetoglobus multicellularis str. Araruama]|uniref:UPF0235 protein OMM_07236 n=1 Tax=Candidatus Magnetoglobus multicellularis str. Araruama TaxID=890399 RepID=A0A1V1PDU8_9BACT|nr:MAG: hypothetical protein OMM_07236 [Candidatus Magnetoglobus multicellularis str. Araruama]